MTEPDCRWLLTLLSASLDVRSAHVHRMLAVWHTIEWLFLTLLFVLAGVITGDTLYQIGDCEGIPEAERTALCVSDVPWVFVTFAFAILIRFAGARCTRVRVARVHPVAGAMHPPRAANAMPAERARLPWCLPMNGSRVHAAAFAASPRVRAERAWRHRRRLGRLAWCSRTRPRFIDARGPRLQSNWRCVPVHRISPCTRRRPCAERPAPPVLWLAGARQRSSFSTWRASRCSHCSSTRPRRRRCCGCSG